MGLTWDLLRTYLGLASDASKQFTSPNPFLDAKLRNLELAVRSSHTFRYDSIRFSCNFFFERKVAKSLRFILTTENTKETENLCSRKKTLRSKQSEYKKNSNVRIYA